MTVSPLAPHLCTPAELLARVKAERAGRPFLVLRDPDAGQILIPLGDHPRLSIGRREECDIAMPWDGRISRLHAELVLIGGEWIIADDGLSANGTRVNQAMLTGRRRLRDGDLIRVGETMIAFCSPADRPILTLEATSDSLINVSPAQRRVLVALCRPFLGDGDLTAPSNAEIAADLHLSIESVKTHMRALFEAFGLGNSQARVKRLDLIQRAVRSGVVDRRDVDAISDS